MKTLIQALAHKAYLMRVDILKMTTQAGSGHPTSALSAADIMAVLFMHVMHVDLSDPHNPNNDRFILSKGHASPVFYAAYKQLGILSEQELMTYRHFDSVLEGHPTPRFAWTEAATGSLGQGLSVGVGMALTAKMDKRDFYTYVLMGDSEVAEGSIWEAAELAAYNKLHNLIGILDVNRLGQSTETMEGWHVDDYARKFAAFGWEPLIVDGHSLQALLDVFADAKKVKHKPTIIIAKTIKGCGVARAENKEGYHGKVFSKQELPEILDELAHRYAAAAKDDQYALELKQPAKAHHTAASITVLEDPTFKIGEEIPTRKAFGLALLALGKKNEQVVSLDAEVKNSTYAEYFADAFPARFTQCFIAEQNMIGMAVGMQKLGKIPFASTFGAFFTRAFDQIRMAAIGRSALRLVGSHAGVSIGEDGPSQMALEDIAIMRTLPHSIVLYPADAVSTWYLMNHMMQYTDGISYLRTTRGATPVIYPANEKFSIGGCKVIKQSQQDVACIVAAGITLFEALKAYELLHKQGINVAVIDAYSIKPLDAATIIRVAERSGNKIITVEDHYLEGGLGQAVIYAVRNTGIECQSLAVTKMARSGKPAELLAFEEIDAAAIIRQVTGRP